MSMKKLDMLVMIGQFKLQLRVKRGDLIQSIGDRLFITNTDLKFFNLC